MMNLSPFKCYHATDIEKGNDDRNHINKDGTHPILDFRTFSGIGLLQKFFPAPSIAFAAAEQDNYQRSKRK